MEISDRLERVRRTKNVEDLVEHLVWLKGAQIPKNKEPILDSAFAEAIRRSVAEDTKLLLGMGALSPQLALRQHSRRLRYYKKLQRIGKEVFGDHSVTARVAEESAREYGGRIAGMAIANMSRLGGIDLARATGIVKAVEPISILAAHQILKGVYVAGGIYGSRYALAGIERTGAEAKILRIPRTTMLGVDKIVAPREVNINEIARAVVPRAYSEIAENVKRHSPKETAIAGIQAGERIRESEKFIAAIVDPKVAKGWAQTALDNIYRKLIAMARVESEKGNVEGARHLIHAAMKVRGVHVREW